MLHLTPYLTAYIVALAVLLGASVGSFLCCAAWRIVHGESVLKGRSHCDTCGQPLGVRDLVPIFSYLFSKGKCRYCGEKIPIKFLLAELLSAAVFVSAVIKYDVTLQGLEALAILTILLGCTFTDLEGYIIPDGFIAAGVVVSLLRLVINMTKFADLTDYLIGSFGIAGILLLTVVIMEKVLKKDAMGGGDIKLIFMVGLYLGWKKNLLCLLVACVLGIIFGLCFKPRDDSPEKGAFPWGPSIAAAAWITMLAGDSILNWYMGMF